MQVLEFFSIIKLDGGEISIKEEANLIKSNKFSSQLIFFSVFFKLSDYEAK